MRLGGHNLDPRPSSLILEYIYIVRERLTIIVREGLGMRLGGACS